MARLAQLSLPVDLDTQRTTFLAPEWDQGPEIRRRIYHLRQRPNQIRGCAGRGDLSLQADDHRRTDKRATRCFRIT